MYIETELELTHVTSSWPMEPMKVVIMTACKPPVMIRWLTRKVIQPDPLNIKEVNGGSHCRPSIHPMTIKVVNIAAFNSLSECKAVIWVTCLIHCHRLLSLLIATPTSSLNNMVSILQFLPQLADNKAVCSALCLHTEPFMF